MNNRITYGNICLMFTIILILVATSCRTIQQTTDSKDLSYIYNPTKSPLNTQYTILNQSDEQSVLSVKFFANELFFSEANPQGVPTASILITVKLFNISLGKVLADTTTYNLSIVKDAGKHEYIYNIPLKVKTNVEYIAEIKILDRLRLKVIQSFVSFNTLSYFNKYNFSARGHFDKNKLIDPILRIDEYVNLVYHRQPVDSLYISYYKPFREIPYPPSIIMPEKTIDYQPDKVAAILYSDTVPMMLPKEGIYLCSVDKNLKDGYTLLNLGSSYPTMNNPDVMIEPLAYLASQKEIDNLKSALKKKVALDDFWIKCGGNVDKARELIRIYYTRVLFANYYFTSYKEGWRSERGMIYVIYGPPDKVYKTSEGESWGYKKPGVKSKWGSRYTVNDEYLFFNFKKRENIFSDNDYYLSRSETLVSNWDQAILSWKKGVVFRFDNPEGI
jgi:GWxTD domain-containing protein